MASPASVSDPFDSVTRSSSFPLSAIPLRQIPTQFRPHQDNPTNSLFYHTRQPATRNNSPKPFIFYRLPNTSRHPQGGPNDSLGLRWHSTPRPKSRKIIHVAMRNSHSCTNLGLS